jgi:two-component system, OmpR family, response regulator
LQVKGMSNSQEAMQRSLRVLVVDDSADCANSLAILLRLAGHSVQVAYSSSMALELARIHQPEAVLLDIGLPGMDGYQVAERLRKREETRGSLIVAISGHAQESHRQRALDAGCDYHLPKPIDYRALEATLDLLREGTANDCRI